IAALYTIYTTILLSHDESYERDLTWWQRNMRWLRWVMLGVSIIISIATFGKKSWTLGLAVAAIVAGVAVSGLVIGGLIAGNRDGSSGFCWDTAADVAFWGATIATALISFFNISSVVFAKTGLKPLISKSKKATTVVTQTTTVQPVQPTESNLWKVGKYNELPRGTGLDRHHVGQKVVMQDFVPGYNANTAPAIMVPKPGHTKGTNVLSRKTTGFTNARQVVARDIMELRRVFPDIPNSALQELINLNITMFGL
ncbi:MAG: hypothetical protein FWC11_03240, partial [Firmicutes bacterium]|nr:hypothetical protein [Bacillota bacterium]